MMSRQIIATKHNFFLGSNFFDLTPFLFLQHTKIITVTITFVVQRADVKCRMGDTIKVVIRILLGDYMKVKNREEMNGNLLLGSLYSGTTGTTYLDRVSFPVISMETILSLLPLGRYLSPITPLNGYLSRGSNDRTCLFCGRPRVPGRLSESVCV